MDSTIRTTNEKININDILATDVQLAPFCSFGTGGNARFFGEPATLAQLGMLCSHAKSNGLPVAVLGGGTNVLVSDCGFDGLVISTRRLKGAHTRGLLMVFECGMPLDQAINMAIEHSLGGLEELGGLPGTIGGAVHGNAGNSSIRIGDLVEWVDVVDSSGNLRRIVKTECAFGYRTSVFSDSNDIIFEVALRLIPTKNSSAARMMKERRLKEREQAGQYIARNAGCVFKNPPGAFAGRLIEQAGCKGRTIGGAQVSSEHANFIINKGSATSKDIKLLMDSIRSDVFTESGISLEPEIRMIGRC